MTARTLTDILNDAALPVEVFEAFAGALRATQVQAVGDAVEVARLRARLAAVRAAADGLPVSNR